MASSIVARSAPTNVPTPRACAYTSDATIRTRPSGKSTIETPNSPILQSLHEQAGAEFQPYADGQVVATFGNLPAEYAAIRKGCALMDLAHRGILELTGRDRLSFLNNLLSNQTWDPAAKTGLPAGQGVYTFFLNVKGRIVADMNVLELGDRTLLETDARMIEPLRVALDRYLFAEQVKLIGRMGALHELALLGPESADVLSRLIRLPLPELPQLGSIRATILGHEAVIWRDDVCGVPGHVVVVPSGAAAGVWGALVGPGAVRPIGWAAFNTARIEAGRPLFGIDFDDTVLPAETGQLVRAVGLTKGCYLGQEIVGRMHSRGQLARQIVGVRMKDDALPVAPVAVQDEQGNEVGQVSSSTLSPLLSNAPICLAMLRRTHIAAGTVVRIAAEGAMREATVVELPFVK